ncbi:hypothetical protein [Haematomicrobium sanguinis]|nr:hypothetical protein [Haematomicrobium sanguinis]
MNTNLLKKGETFLGSANGSGVWFDRIKTLAGITPGVVFSDR